MPRNRHFWLLALFGLNFHEAEDSENNQLKSGYGISRSVNFKYIRDISICKQNIGMDGVKSIRSSADRE